MSHGALTHCIRSRHPASPSFARTSTSAGGAILMLSSGRLPSGMVGTNLGLGSACVWQTGMRRCYVWTRADTGPGPGRLGHGVLRGLLSLMASTVVGPMTDRLEPVDVLRDRALHGRDVTRGWSCVDCVRGRHDVAVCKWGSCTRENVGSTTWKGAPRDGTWTVCVPCAWPWCLCVRDRRRVCA